MDCTKKEQHERKHSGSLSNKSSYQQNTKKKTQNDEVEIREVEAINQRTSHES